MIRQLTLDELNDGIAEIRKAPLNGGVLRAIVIRPATDERVSLTQCELSPAEGVQGDNWASGCWKSLPDGRPHPDVQVTIMNARAISLIAPDENRWPLSGDNLIVDLDLSDENLPSGQRISIGTAILEITAEAHNGCRKFAERFGAAALQFVNSEQGKTLHLRGIYAKVVQAGVVRVGETVNKLRFSESGR